MDKNDKKIVLFYPKTGFSIKNVSIVIPQSVLYVGTALKMNGYDVKIIDTMIDDNWRATFKKELEDGIIAVGISCMTGMQILASLDIAKYVRELNPDIPLIWGGIHPSLLPEQTLENPYVDFVVIGDGEETTVDLINNLGNRENYKNIPGIAFKNGGKIVVNPPRKPFDLNKIPIPDYSLLDVRNYITSQTKGERDIVVHTSRGCPHRCTYCYNPAFHHRRYRTLTPENVVRHIKYIIKNYNITAINLNEDNFFTDKARVEKICQLLIKENVKIKIRTQCRVDYIVKYSDEFLKLIRKAGIILLYLGGESGSNKILKKIKKDITREQIITANRILKGYDISPRFSFMGGFPGESIEDFKETLDLMRVLIEENPAAYTTPIQLFSPYPGTELFDLAVEHNFKPPSTLEGYSKSNWNEIDYEWLTEKEKNFLENASFFTYFIDSKSVAEYTGNHFILRVINRIYGKIIRLRIRFNFYFFMPEVYFIKYFIKKRVHKV